MLKLGPGLDHLGAEQANRREVFAHLRLDERRVEPLAGIIIDQERAVGAQLRAEEAGRCVGQNLIFPGCDIEPEDVRDAGIISIAEQRLAVRGEREILRDRRRERQRRDRIVGIALLEVGAFPHLDRLLAIDRAIGCGHQLAIGRDVEVEDHLAIMERLDLVEAGVRRRHPDHGHEPVLVTNAPQALVGPVEGEVADPGVGQQAPLLAGVDIDRVEFAIGVILVGIESGPGCRVEGDAGHLVQHHAVEFGQRRELAGGEVHAPEEADPPGIAERRDQAVGLVVNEAARHRAQSARRQMLDLGQRKLRQRGEVRFLELMFESDPVGPHLVERLAEHMFELAGVESP